MLFKDWVMSLQNSKHDITKVLEHYGFEVPHGRRGWFTLRCAFHGDKVKSARLNIDNGGFRCFGCDMAGDVYSLIMKREGVGFNEAKQIAERITGESNGELRKKPNGDTSVPDEQRYHRTDRSYISPRLRKRA
jgi:DNA primase